MPRMASVDFTGAPPAQGAIGSDYVPPGRYLQEVVNVEATKSKTDKRMWVASIKIIQGPEGSVGKQLVDRFVIDSDPGKQPFGKQRLHAFLLSFGLKVTEKPIQLDLDNLTGLRSIVEVRDEYQPANGEYAARTVSRVVAYYPVPAAGGAAAAPAATPASASAPAPAPAPQPVAEVATPAVAETPAQVETLASEIDDLFAQ